MVTISFYWVRDSGLKKGSQGARRKRDPGITPGGAVVIGTLVLLLGARCGRESDTGVRPGGAPPEAAALQQPPGPSRRGVQEQRLGRLRTSPTGEPLLVRAYFDAQRTRAVLRVGDTTSKLYRAWHAELSDLDGDGVDEVVLGVWSDRVRHSEPAPHRAVWVLGWDPVSRQLRELWRGSALAKPLLGFHMRGARLVARERAGKRCYTTTYEWTGFGFAVVRARPAVCGGS